MSRFLSLLLCLLVVWNGGIGLAFAEQITYYHTDAAGTSLAISDAAGQKVWEADYKPFGEEFSTTGSAANDRRFVGKEKDEETGLNYFGARYLAAGTGRFLSPDVVRAVDLVGRVNNVILSEPQRLNVYAYSVNNPSKYVDPDGKNPLLLLAVGGAFISGNLMTPGVANGPDVGGKIYDGPSPGKVLRNTGIGALSGMPARILSATKAADDFVDLTTPERRVHILDGDATGPGGGHRFGTGRSGKSEFPASWSDDRIIHEISDAATDPNQIWTNPNARGYITTTKTTDGVEFKVVFNPRKSEIVTGFPTNMRLNP